MSEENEADDNEESVPIAELRRLRKVFEASSDLCKAYWSIDFRVASGGIEALKLAHAAATADLEKWYADGEG